MNPDNLDKLEAGERFEKIPRKVHAERRNGIMLKYKREKIDWNKKKTHKEGWR